MLYRSSFKKVFSILHSWNVPVFSHEYGILVQQLSNHLWRYFCAVNPSGVIPFPGNRAEVRNYAARKLSNQDFLKENEYLAHLRPLRSLRIFGSFLSDLQQTLFQEGYSRRLRAFSSNRGNRDTLIDGNSRCPGVGWSVEKIRGTYSVFLC